jgi:transcriptional regulator with XRE-family HTH domain
MTSVVKLRQQIAEQQNRIREQVGRNLKLYRDANDLTQQALSEMTGVERTSITNIECGKNNMTIEQLLGFCEVFEITPNDMLDNLEGV